LSTADYTHFRAGKSKEIERLELQAKSFSEIFEKQIQLLNVKKGSRVLDAGCGTGSFARNIASIVFPEIVSAVDIDSVFIEEAKRLAANEGKTNIAFHIGNIENLDFLESETVDVVYCRLVLPHLENPVKAIQELKRVTRKGGRISFSDEGDIYTYPSIDKFFDLFSKASQWRKATQIEATTKRVSAHELFKSSGLQNITIYPIPQYASSSESPEKLRSLALVLVQMLELYKDEVISKGFMTKVEYQEGVQHLENWLARQDAFWLVLTLFTTGTV
jgi:ubiquinone/menaquinone biosynthesis C-methylase UbiE